MSSREKIDNLIIEADSDIQEKNISSGLQKLEIAKQMAIELGWDERVRTIKSMIEEANKKVKIQEERARKQKEIEQKKLENIEKEKQLEAARQRLQDRKTAEKNQKLEALRKKKEIEEKLSIEAYDLLEVGSKALLKDDYQLGIDSFTNALEKFKTIKWSAEVNRTFELLNDAQSKFQNYQKKLKDDELKAEQVWEAQKETQKTIELSNKIEDEKKRLQESIDMEHKKEELLKKAKSEKALSLLDDAIQFRNLNQFDSATNAYKEALKIFKRIGWQKEAGEVEEEIGLTIKQREKLELEKKQLEDNLIKKRLDEEAIEKLAKESQQMRDSKEKAEREKRQKELEILSQKESKLKEILSNISEIEDLVNNYENQVHLGKILSLECPYPNAIRTYGEGSEKLREIGYFEQADRLADGESSYKQRIFEDEKLRENEKKRLEKLKQDEEEIEKKAKEAQILRDEKLKIEKEKRQKELELMSKKESRLKDVLKDISIIEEVISGYESRIGLGKILSLECPYPKAVELYYIGTNKLREIGLIEQADRLEEGVKTYKLKIAEDNKLREIEKQRLEKIKQENEEIERKAIEAQKLREVELNIAKEKRQNELEKLSQKDSKLKEVLAKISDLEELININEKQGDFNDAKNRYSEAIELYRISSEKLSEIGFHEHSKLLKDGEVSYKQKLLIFERKQEEKRKRLEKVQNQEEEFEQKAKESQRIKELKEKEQREKRQKELEALSKKESKLKTVLDDISKIEDTVNLYAKEVGLGKILSLECPYPKAVELYNIGMQKLREAGLIEQADRLDEGRKTYEIKIIEDDKLREREKQRIEKTKLDEEEIERKAEEARKAKELKDRELREKRQKELEALSKKESKLKTVLDDISKIEDTVNLYAKEVGLGKILSLECPYPKAVELYNIGMQKLREAGLIEQADRLDEGRKTYEIKIIEDDKLREREKQRIEKTKLDEEEIERKAEEARKAKELKDRELREKRQKELEALSKKESKLKTVLDDISKIEDTVNLYAKEVGLGKILSLECPYPKAVELYNIGMQKLREAGLIEQADRLDEGRKTYEQKSIEDKKLREREKQRIEKTKLDEEEIERKAEEARKAKELKDRELREKRQKELEALSKKESKLKTVLDEISKIEDTVNLYAKEVGLGKILSLECPYPKAVELYNIGMQKLREAGLIEQADRLDEGRKTYEQKSIEDKKLREREKQRIEKARLDEEEIDQKAEEARKVKELKEKEQREKRQKELEALSKKESKLKTVLDEISKIEDTVNLYAKEVGLGKILSLECPYPKAVELYNIGMQKLREAGLIEQADRLDEGRKTYEQKSIEDKKLREREKQRIEKARLDEEEIDQKAEEARKVKELKEKEQREKRQKELEALSKKESKLKTVLDEISKIEDTVNLYAKEVGLGKILSLECPYPKAVELYNIGMQKLREAGLIEQADRLDEGRKTYEQKSIEDKKLREREKQRIERVRLDEEEIDQKAEEARKVKELKDRELREKRQKELEAISQKESQLKDVLDDISIIEDVVNEYAREVGLGRILSLECPYPKAVELYNIGMQKLREAGLIEQANSLDEGRKTYESKILEDKKIREREKKRIEKVRLDEEEIERKAEEAQRLQELKEKELREKRQIELEAISQKESRLKDVLGDISKIEDVVNEYAKGVGLGNILSLECPYPKAVDLYNIGTNKLREIGLIEQADRLDEGRKAYKLKILEDKKLREREKQRVENVRLEKEEFERKAKESQRIKDLKDKELREKRQKELEAISQKESKLKDVLGDISKIEDVVNEYAKGVGLGKILSLECPYPKAVELYNIGTNKLREIGLIEQADRLDEGRKTYEQKIIDDKHARELEKQRLTKIEIDKEKLEMQAQVAAKLKEIKKKEVSEKKKKEQMKLSGQREILTVALNAIEKIEKKVKKYEDQVSLGKILSTKCPYPNAIEIYRESSNKLKELGLLEQSARLNDGYLLYKEKLVFDEKNRKLEEETIRKNQESKLELEQQILKSQKKKEGERLQKEQEKAVLNKQHQMEQKQANQAFSLMDEGNKLAKEFKFDDAIEKFQEAMDIFDEIKWLAELDKVLLQISIFRKQKDQKELEKIEEEELRVKKQKEMEEIDQKAKLSWEKKLEEERKKSEIKQSETEEKRKQWELEFQRKIEDDKKKRELEEQERLEQFQREQEIGLKHQNVYDDCLNLLDQAKTMVTEQQFEPAINIYKNVVEKYSEINYSEGIRITNESILKVQKLWDDHKFDIEIAQKSLKEREEEEKRLERLISESKQKDERNKLLAEQKKLKSQLEKEKVAHAQNEIISILEIAGDLTNENQFDKALEYYDKAIGLFKKIDWDLKYKQVLSIIQDVKAKKKHFIKLEKELADKQKKDIKAQKAFKNFLEKQEADRKSKGEKVKKLTEQQQTEFNYRVTLEDASYEYIDQAEKCVKGRKYYLSLYYFHYALNNFIEIEWAREAKALKKRFLQVYNLISNPLMDINEILTNPKLDLEYHFANSLSLILLAQKRKDFLVAQTELNTVSEMAKNLKWPKSLKLLDDFKEILEQEKEEYRKEIEMKKYAPTESKALNVMTEASGKIKNYEFEEGLELANKAKEIYIQLGNEKEARRVEQELLRWKLKYTRHQLNQQRQKSRGVESEKKTFLSEDERKNLIIEERKKRRRDARKRLLGD